MCSPTDLALLNDAQAARTRVEMELATLAARLDRYDTPPEVLQAIRRAQRAADDVKGYQQALYGQMAAAHARRIGR